MISIPQSAANQKTCSGSVRRGFNPQAKLRLERCSGSVRRGFNPQAEKGLYVLLSRHPKNIHFASVVRQRSRTLLPPRHFHNSREIYMIMTLRTSIHTHIHVDTYIHSHRYIYLQTRRYIHTSMHILTCYFARCALTIVANSMTDMRRCANRHVCVVLLQVSINLLNMQVRVCATGA